MKNGFAIAAPLFFVGGLIWLALIGNIPIGAMYMCVSAALLVFSILGDEQ